MKHLVLVRGENASSQVNTRGNPRGGRKISDGRLDYLMKMSDYGKKILVLMSGDFMKKR